MVVRIDGSKHTGGGGMLRVALGLSMLTGEPLSMTNIRAGRDTPGLRAQHLASVRIAAQMCSASLEGAEIGSERIVFMPARLEAGAYELDLKTAGSIPLALQPAILAATLSGKRFSFHLRGGTDVPHAPSGEYLRSVFLPALRPFAKSDVEIAERGFYPRGDGRMIVKIHSEYSTLARIGPINYATPSKPAKLEFRITSTQQRYDETRERIELSGRGLGIDTTVSVNYTNAASPGTTSTIIVHQASPIVRAIGHSTLEEEGLAEHLVARARELLTVPCDAHLADQLIPYLAYHEGAVQHPLTEHMRAAIEVCEAFLPGRLEVDETSGIVTARNREGTITERE